jgi:hypothetical protein
MLTAQRKVATVGGVHWDDTLLSLFEDLEQQAEGLALAERDSEVAELSRAEYAEIDLSSRWHGSVGCALAVTVSGIGTIEARLARVGRDWCLLEAATAEWVVPMAAVAGVRGLSDRASAAQARALHARLGLGSVLRSIAAEASPVVLHRVDGTLSTGRLRRIGADFAELAGSAHGQPELVPFSVIAGLRRC